MYVSSYYNNKREDTSHRNIYLTIRYKIYVKKYSMGCMYDHIIIKREKIHPIENIFNNSIQIYGINI